MNNILQCASCGAALIAEEFNIHFCRKKVIDYKIEKNVLWVYDGENWYTRKLLKTPTENQQRFKTPEDSTEPKVTIEIKLITNIETSYSYS